MTAASGLDGRLVERGQPDYAAARLGKSWNRRVPDRFPPAVLQAASEADVVAGIRLARERGWKVAVRSGGHSWAHWPLRDDALLIDLAGLRELELDGATGVVRASPAVQGGAELAPYLAERGRFFPVGHCPTVGIGGFLLQGGMGWNTRGVGWAAASVRALDVVTADGELVHVNADEHADLLWAARGAGPGFPGVVTRFHLDTRPLPVVRRTSYVLPAAQSEAVLRWAMQVHELLSPEVEFIVTALTPPQGSPIVLAHGMAFTDSVARASAALAPLADFPLREHALAVQVDEPSTWLAELAQTGTQYVPDHRLATDNLWSDASAAELAPLAGAAAADPPSAATTFLWSSNAGSPLPDGAFSTQGAHYVALYVAWRDETDDARCRSWLADHMRAMQHLTTGQYVGDSDFSTRTVRMLGDPQWLRLARVRAERDPDGLFAGHLAKPGVVLNTNEWEMST